MALFTKKPVTVEASQWFKNGDHPQDYTKDVNNQFPDEGAPPVYTAAYRRENNWEGDVVRYYRHPDVPSDRPCEQCGKPHHVHGWIDTLEQGHRVCPGDWIITGVKGERYPCKPDIFATTYAPAAQPSQAPVVQAVPVNCGTGYCSCIECVVEPDRASSGATTPTAPFAKDSWQHAVDNQLVAFGRTSQEFANPHEALAWLAIMNMELGQSNAGAATQAVRMLTDAARDVLAERQRQISAEGWTPEHDDEHDAWSMAVAAACYSLWDRPATQATTGRLSNLWQWTGWDQSWFKPKDPRRNLVRAAALLLAEIERLDRAGRTIPPSGEIGGV